MQITSNAKSKNRKSPKIIFDCEAFESIKNIEFVTISEIAIKKISKFTLLLEIVYFFSKLSYFF